MNCILKGDLSITDNIDFVREIAYSPSNSNVKVISVEEVPSIDVNLPNVIGGAFLLPPIDAMMAAANDDEYSFRQLYIEHLNTPPVMDFISIMLSALYKNISLVLFYPEDDLNLKSYMLDIFFKMFGVAIGEIGSRQCQYDVTAAPIWFESLLAIGTIDSMEFLYLYPEEAIIPDRLIYNLITAIAPTGNTYQDKVDFILDLRHKLKQNRNLIIPFKQV